MSASTPRIALLTLLILALAAGSAAALVPEAGVRVGVNFSSLQNASYPTDSRKGLQAGGFLNVGLNPFFSLGVEALYSQKGVDAGNATLALDYFEFPLLLRFSIPAPGPVPVFFTGPAVAFKQTAEVRPDSGSDMKIPDEFLNTTDFGWVVGAAVGFPVGAQKLFIDLRYTLGLQEIFDFNDPMDSDSDDKNQAVSIGVGFTFF